jgi:hypothetical protein
MQRSTGTPAENVKPSGGSPAIEAGQNQTAAGVEHTATVGKDAPLIVAPTGIENAPASAPIVPEVSPPPGKPTRK